MAGLTFGLFAFSTVLFLGAFYHIISITKPGFYPPKKILKKRAGGLAFGGVIFFAIGIAFSSFL
ncbi:hypothetical protein [Bacillus dakarensis]|uniref:hypothetical protein n=1 Tax=Robertmurraya dakarensis TaxID=1926278 RepID=UPI00098122E2|nr:hypothetical protein [Bacillus dakarensis]